MVWPTDTEKLKSRDTLRHTADGRNLPPTAVKKAGAEGETLFYRTPNLEPAEPGGTLSPSWNIDGKRVCDFIGPGRQTLLPPTIHPDTKQLYRWNAAPYPFYSDPERNGDQNI